jgi:hypothetical protein
MRPGQRLPLEFAYARELLQAGQNQAALQAFDVLEQDIKAVSPELWEAQGSAIVIQRATTWLRIAEEQNCHQGNTPDSCLLPIRGQGIHLKREGATRAGRGPERAPRSRPQEPRGPVAPERRLHDARRLPGERAPRAAHPARGLRVGSSAAPVRERGQEDRDRRLRPVRRGRARRLRRRRPPRPGPLGHRPRRPAALLPQPRRRHLRGSVGAGRPARDHRRAQHGPGGLRQRRAGGHPGPARGVDEDGRALPALAAAERRRRPLRRRDQGGGPAALRPHPDRHLVRLRRRRMARPVRRERVRARRRDGAGRSPPVRALPQQPRRHLQRGGARIRRRGRRLRQGRGERRLRQRRPAGPLRLRPGRGQRPVPQRRARRRRRVALHRRRPRGRASPSPCTASGPSSSTTTTTDGRTST